MYNSKSKKGKVFHDAYAHKAALIFVSFSYQTETSLRVNNDRTGGITAVTKFQRGFCN